MNKVDRAVKAIKNLYKDIYVRVELTDPQFFFAQRKITFLSAFLLNEGEKK